MSIVFITSPKDVLLMEDFTKGMQLLFQRTPSTDQQALLLFQKCGEQGLLPAIVQLGQLFMPDEVTNIGQAIPKDIQLSLKWLRMARDRADLQGTIMLATLYQVHFFDMEQAITTYKYALTLPDLPGHFHEEAAGEIARLRLPVHKNGIPTATPLTDMEEAASYLQRAVALGAHQALTHLLISECHLNGWCGRAVEDIFGPQRLYHLQLAAEKGSVRAQILLGGTLKIKPNASPADRKEAQKWMKQAVLKNKEPDALKMAMAVQEGILVSSILLLFFSPFIIWFFFLIFFFFIRFNNRCVWYG